MNDESITEILIDNFATDKSLREIQQDHEDLELMIARGRGPCTASSDYYPVGIRFFPA